MTDSLVLGGVIELLGGGPPSVHPQAAGAYFRLGPGFDLSVPQVTAEQVAGLLLDGEVVTGFRASNRTPTLPVVIYVPPTGNSTADRRTLAGARELLLQTASQENWELTWTRDGADPLIFDCMGLSAVVVHYSVKTEQALVSLVDVTFQAFPYGRSDAPETLVFNAPSAVWGTPPAPVTVDDFTTAVNWLAGDASTFDATAGTWTNITNCAVTRVTTPVRSGAGALRMRSSAAGNMNAEHVATASVVDTGLALPCRTGDTINVRAWLRAATIGRNCAVGARFLDSNGTVISTLRGSSVANVTTGYTQITGSVTAPSQAVWAVADVQVLATGAASEDHFVDDVSLDRGPVFSYTDASQWTRSTVAATGSFSAFWSRVSHDNPVYDHILPAPVNLTGRTKLVFWLGLATTSSQWPVWHYGNVHAAITLTDGNGVTLSLGVKRRCAASALPNKPHWQFLSANIPQVASGFDFTTISRYSITLWNTWDAKAGNGTGGQSLQASAYLGLVQATATAIGSPVNRGAFYTLPGIVGTARAPLALQAAPGPSSFSTIAEFSTAGSNPWTAPAGLTKVDKAEVWGAGGGGAGSDPTLPTGNGGGGAGAGEYAMEINVPVTALGSYPVVIGAAGTHGTLGSGPNDAAGGGDTYWSGNSGNQVYAHGGMRGWKSHTAGGGKGGDGSTNYVHYPGGSGRQSNVISQDTGASGGYGGGGGGSGGQAQPGNDGGGGSSYYNPFDTATGTQPLSGARAVAGGGPGGDGGHLNPALSNTGHSPTTGPGGGGGGGALMADGTGRGGGDGMPGFARLTYGATGLLPLTSLLVHSPGASAPDSLNPLVPAGGGADTPNGGTEYPVPDVGNLNARFDGTYTMYLVAGTWNSPGASRNLNVQLRQYPYAGGTAAVLNVARNGVVPSTDITNGYVDMGPVTLPLAQLSPGGLDSYFTLTVSDSNTADRFLDVLLIDTQGQLVLVNVPGASVWNNIWIDSPDASQNLGLILGSPADRDQASSLLQYADRFSGGPLMVSPDRNNRLLVYAAQGAPALTASYTPNWWTERLA